MSRRTALLTALALSAVSGCREGVPPFSPVEIAPDEGELVRLTFNAGDERDPRWSPAGDTVYYHTDSWPELSGYRGILLQIPASGGTATRLAAAAQPTAAAKLMLPVPSPDGTRLAYLHLRRERGPATCTLGASICPVPAPQLDTGAVKVRRFDAGTSTFGDPGITVGYPSGPTSLEPPFLEIIYPYHHDYIDAAEVTSLRASWAPDGERLVYSDGTRLLLWRVGDTAPVAIPNTDDGVAPAWSRDGQWIAFGVLQRGEQHNYLCNCGSAVSPIPVERQEWDLVARLIARVRPDGSDFEILTEGSEPAWTPDGSALYFRRGDAGLYRIATAGGDAVAIPNTARARAPAVAPDGSAVLFARRDPGSAGADFNIWRLRLEP